MAHKTTVVVDGSNVITANIGEKTFFRVNRIINVINKLKKLGYTYKVGMKAKTYNYITHHAPEEKIDEARAFSSKDSSPCGRICPSSTEPKSKSSEIGRNRKI